MELSSEARNLNWLVQNFAERVPGVNEAVVVSSDGLPIATSSGLDRDAADRFAAVSSGLIGLAYGAAGRFGGGAVNEVIIEMENAFLFVTGISDGSCLACVAIGRVRRRPGRLRDGRPGREGRHRPHARAPGRAAGTPSAMTMADDELDDGGPALRVRSYVITQGRTRSSVDLPARDPRQGHPPRGVRHTPAGARAQADHLALQHPDLDRRDLGPPPAPPRCRPRPRGRHGRTGSAHQLQAATRQDGRTRPDLKLLERVLDGLQAL